LIKNFPTEEPSGVQHGDGFPGVGPRTRAGAFDYVAQAGVGFFRVGPRFFYDLKNRGREFLALRVQPRRDAHATDEEKNGSAKK
jgi:hypothetical protein